MSASPLAALAARFHRGEHAGIVSVCSAHPIVIEAALRTARAQGRSVLIEATCNQVNQEGGYTGQTPQDFRAMVETLATTVGLDPALVILGGDHLGPNPWKHLPAAEAMDRADTLVRTYARAGFVKLHLDASMGCQGEPTALPDSIVASRTARLAAAAEAVRSGADPIYVIGTEVPEPGGHLAGTAPPAPTPPEAMLRTYDSHRAAFMARGLEKAFGRVTALVVQPGVEFSHASVHRPVPPRIAGLVAALRTLPGVVFEAHSTDYQSAADLRTLVVNGFAILKVGPALTFALREALYALDAMADRLAGQKPTGTLMAVMEQVMCEAPSHWAHCFAGSQAELRDCRHFSRLDRIRYYWARPVATAAVARLMERLAGVHLSTGLVHDHLPGMMVPMEGSAHDILIGAVQAALGNHDAACRAAG